MEKQLVLFETTPEPAPPVHVRVPKDWLLRPVFVPGIQPKNREIIVNGNKWVMGINNPLTKNIKPSSNITLGHIKVALAVLTFFHGKNPVVMSVTELAKRCADSRGGRYYRDLLQKMEDLREYWVSVTDDAGVTKKFTLLGKVTLIEKTPKKKPIGKKQRTEAPLWLDSVELHEEFVEFMKDFAKTLHLRFDTVRQLTSEIASSIYLYLPSRAHHHTKEDPFEITLSLLFEQLGLEKRSKSVRHKLLTQNKNSIISQLDGAETLTGRLRIELKETKDKSDWKLIAWEEREVKTINWDETESKLIAAWTKSGRSKDEFNKKLLSLAEIDSYEIELLEKAEIEHTRCFKFLRQAKTLLGENRFGLLLSESKNEALEGRQAKNPTGAFIWRLLAQIEQR